MSEGEPNSPHDYFSLRIPHQPTEAALGTTTATSTSTSSTRPRATHEDPFTPTTRHELDFSSPSPIAYDTLPVISHSSHSRSPSATGLHLQTDLTSPAAITPPIPSPSLAHHSFDNHYSTSLDPTSAGSWSGIRRALSNASMASSLSPGSAYSSPALNALLDITPLPSPLMLGESPEKYKRARPESQGSLASASDFLSTNSIGRSASKKKYHGLMPAAVEAASVQAGRQRDASLGHTRNRSLSEYVPPQLTNNMRPRNVTLSGHKPEDTETPEKPQMHREEYLAHQRGLAPTSPKKVSAADLPTPPPSNRSTTESEEEEAKDDGPLIEYLSIRHGPSRRVKLYRPVRPLGQGTFSKVILATSEKQAAKGPLDEATLDPKQLVAIKIAQNGPAGGADEERIGLSLKREIEMLQSISHPALIHLKAYDRNESQTLLVLTYCPGGDLFDLASSNRDILSPALVQRIFAELVSAVYYLHTELIVHRDIKLENVLCNITAPELSSLPSPRTHPTPLITLTDLGLSRRIPLPPASPLLETRCGSEDYAAPEILLGQPYDGRQTDAWALGVLLYSLIEGRLPFDPPPGKQGRSRGRTAHRVARCEWGWWRFGDEDGEWDDTNTAGIEWLEARRVVEGLLKKVSRGRLGLDAVKEMQWVKDGIQVDGGMRRREEDLLSIDDTVDMVARGDGGRR
ncbi:kinase-like protein [Pseudovirgaria hyperparasitica]|uniref:Kinase-like protein n=1 Tax=Pseudovirgaria hyperparasitica TaxID=470096 RepID=A0A6A6WMH4_9PEZI|nr:kinase-like protein [Pseudovirgaria hyperparasitica]KAF2763405.1 kinase-like protein [Pseudovirgaria hyperparasitica]